MSFDARAALWQAYLGTIRNPQPTPADVETIKYFLRSLTEKNDAWDVPREWACVPVSILCVSDVTGEYRTCPKEACFIPDSPRLKSVFARDVMLVWLPQARLCAA